MSLQMPQPSAAEFRFPDRPSLPEHLRQMREQVSRFVKKEVLPVAETWEREGKIPREIYRKMQWQLRAGGLALQGG